MLVCSKCIGNDGWAEKFIDAHVEYGKTDAVQASGAFFTTQVCKLLRKTEPEFQLSRLGFAFNTGSCE